jgi:hypothetical protein
MKSENTCFSKNFHLQEWNYLSKTFTKDLEICQNVSSFPNGIKEICQSQISIVCAIPSLPCSG